MPILSIISKSDNSLDWQGERTTSLSCSTGEGINRCDHFGKQLDVFCKLQHEHIALINISTSKVISRKLAVFLSPLDSLDCLVALGLPTCEDFLPQPARVFLPLCVKPYSLNFCISFSLLLTDNFQKTVKS